jgi:O-antigen/teichoic acid export membrane protein
MPLQKLKSDTFLSSSALIFLSKAFTSLAGLAVLLWYSKVLPQDVYGSYNNFWVQANVFFPIACFGVHVWLITYSPKVLAQILAGLKVSHYMAYSMWFLLVCSVFAALQGMVGNVGFILSFLFIVTYGLAFIAEAFLIASRSYLTLLIASLAYSVAYWLAHWYVFNSGFSLQAIFSYLLGVNTLKLLLSVPSVISSFRRTEKAGGPLATGNIRSLWLHMATYDVVQSFSGWIDKFIISLVLPAAVSATYANGAMNIPFLPILVSAAGSAVVLQLADSGELNERNNAVMLMNRSGRVLSAVVFPIFFFLLFFNAELIHTLLPRYANAIPIFIVSLLVLPVRAYSFTSVFQRMHRGDIINKGAVGEIVLALALMYPLYQWIGLPGVALSFVLSTYLQAAYYMWQYTHILEADLSDLMPFRNWMQKLIVFGFLFIVIHNAASAYFSEKIVLFLGAAVMAVSVVVSLGLELGNGANEHVDS